MLPEFRRKPPTTSLSQYAIQALASLITYHKHESIHSCILSKSFRDMDFIAISLQKVSFFSAKIIHYNSCNGKHGVHNVLIRDLFVILEVF